MHEKLFKRVDTQENPDEMISYETSPVINALPATDVCPGPGERTTADFKRLL